MIRVSGLRSLVWALVWVTAHGGCEEYSVETIEGPPGVVFEVGSLTFQLDGTLMATTRRGQVWARKDATWNLFAEGLHEPLGVAAGEQAGELYVLQRPELTRLTDLDGDGKADRYECLCADWGLNGHETEYAFGLVRDAEGNFWGALGQNWGSGKPLRYGGWSFRITPAGTFEPWSLGLRVPNGVGVSPQGEVFASDNQGEWVGTSVLHHISKDAFHGCPWGIQAYPGYEHVPHTEVALTKRRKPPALNVPFDRLSRSLGQPLWDTTEGRFGPFAGQLFMPDQTVPRVIRATLEKVEGVWQGACYPFQREGLLIGGHRAAFAPDGSLWLGQTVRGWLPKGNEGLQRIVWNDQPTFEILELRLCTDGFEIRFTEPAETPAAARAGLYALQQFYYPYHGGYGAPVTDLKSVHIARVTVVDDGMRVRLQVPDLVAGRIYGLRIDNLKSKTGRLIRNAEAYYTLNAVRHSDGE